MRISSGSDRHRYGESESKGLLIWLTVFAIAMGYFEAALVVYLRGLLYPADVLQIFPMRPISLSLLVIELGRETATIVMLASVAIITRTTLFRRLAVFAYLFGLWDIFYYVWLKVTIGWPTSWLEWDVLFLVPWVWLGPWVCPAMVAVLYTVWGGRALTSRSALHIGRQRLGVFVIGALLCLTSFLQPAISVLLEAGVAGLERYVPDGFWWASFSVGWVLMAVALPWGRYSSKSPSRRATKGTSSSAAEHRCD
jgi:hypothetical protein